MTKADLVQIEVVAPADAAAAAADLDDERVRRVELVISVLLRIGVVTSLVIVVAGTVVTFLRHRTYLSSRTALHGLIGAHAEFPHTPTAVVHGVARGDGPAIVIAGLLVLIATPVLRVAVSIFAFVYQRDRTFVVITSFVLALLLASFALGRAGG